jgi:YaiO family outer membrane protein
MTRATNQFCTGVATCFVACCAYGQTAPAASGTQENAQALTGSVQLSYGRAKLSDNSPNWRDVSLRGNVNLGEKTGVLNWEASQQKHFGESGQVASAALTHDFNPDWYGTVGVGLGSGARFLSKRRYDVALYRKWLAQRQWVTGLQFTASKSGDAVHDDRAWQLSSSYYFEFPLVAELGFKRNTSDPGKVSTNRYYVAATYGENKKYYLSGRYDNGREGYLPQGANVSAANFKSHVTTLTGRQWLSAQWGYELQFEHYSNPFYRRRGWVVSVFRDF